MAITVQTCEAWDDNLVCKNGVSWIDVGTDKGYCEAHAKAAPMVVQLRLRHVYYGEPYIFAEEDENSAEWGE